MSSLSERLQALGVHIGTDNLPKSRGIYRNTYPIENVLPGNWWETPHGDVFYLETRYKADYQLGRVSLSPMGCLDMVAAWAKEPGIKDIPLEEFIFIDTETTGLSGGTGTYTFLIGAGRFEGDHFRLVQFFLLNPGEETAQLAAFEEFSAPCKVIVSFNGKAFDVPMIKTRYITNGWPCPIDHLPHIDLLHLARRLWKDRLPSRALGDLEWHILGAKRSDKDVPGWMIADLYLDYLHTGDARPLRSVFYHNEIDVVSLSALLGHMSRIISDPFQVEVEYGQDMAAIGKLYADLGYLDRAADLYQRSLELDTDDSETYWEAVSRLSFIQKKRGELSAAELLWTKAAEKDHLYACEELAKLQEHAKRDYLKALEWTENALQIIARSDIPSYVQVQWEESLTHRKDRLRRKIENRRGKKDDERSNQ